MIICPEPAREWSVRSGYCHLPVLLLFVSFLVLIAAPVFGQSIDAGAEDTTAPDREALFAVFHEFRAGVIIGTQLRTVSARFSVKPATDSCGVYDGGTTTSTAFSFLLDVVPEPLPRAWIPLRLSRVNRSLTLRSGERIQPARAPSGELIDVSTRNILDVRASGFTVTLGFGWQIGDVVRLGAGPSLTLQSVDAVRNLEEIVSPPEARFPENDEATRPFRLGREVDVRPIVPGCDLLASACLQIGPFVAVHPEFRVGLPLVDNASDVPWHEVEFEGRIGVSFDLASRSLLSDTTSDSAAAPHAVPPPVLRATISAFGVDDRGKRYENPVIEIEQTPWAEIVPLIPYVFFDSASRTIPARYVQLRDADEAARFSVDSLEDVSALDIHRQNLNIIGRRLRENTGATLDIVGTVSSDESEGSQASLGRARAEAVARYLEQVWGIDASRISTSFTARSLSASPEDNPEGRSENRRVEMVVADARLLDPVVLRRIVSVASPPSVVFTPDIVADTAVAEWYISIAQGDRELLRFRGDTSSSSLQQQKEWSLSDLRVRRDLTPIVYRLTVRDVTGQTVSTEGSFRVLERAHTRARDTVVDVYNVAEYSLVGFDYNSSELRLPHLTQIGDLAASLSPTATVSVIGYTDRVGDRERNRTLSLQRAQRVAEALRLSRIRRGKPPISEIDVEGLGSQREVFDNGCPEGRLLSRMVRIIVVSPSPKTPGE